MIASFDPGITTAVVTATNVDYAARTYDLGECGLVLYDDRAKLLHWLDIRKYDLEAIVIEDFKLFAQRAQSQINSRFETVRVIERIVVYAEQCGLGSKVVMQDPHLRLRARGMPQPHAQQLKNNRHLVAAYQHLRYYVFMRDYKERTK